jgi:hypothetical protein
MVASMNWSLNTHKRDSRPCQFTGGRHFALAFNALFVPLLRRKPEFISKSAASAY